MASLSLILYKYESAMNKLQDEVTYELHMKDEILSLFPPVQLSHAGTTRIVSRPNILDISARLHKTKTTADIRMILQTDAIKFRDFLIHLITSLQDQQRMHIWETIDQTSEATGNRINGKGRNFWDIYIEALERQKFGFDENGNPLYRVYMNSETLNKITVLPTPEQLGRMKEVIRSKRDEYFAIKRARRLS